MTAVLKLAAALLLLGGLAAEGGAVLHAPGVALALGVCLGAYLWFLATARRVRIPSRGRQR